MGDSPTASRLRFHNKTRHAVELAYTRVECTGSDNPENGKRERPPAYT